MRWFLIGAAVLAGCAHAADQEFTRQYVAVRQGAQQTGRSGTFVITSVGRQMLQVTDTRTKEPQLAPEKSDEEVAALTERVNARFGADRELRRRHIQARADASGTVTLSGDAGPPSNAARATLDTLTVPGVHVVNTDFR
jgi:osmotically-inducible protein OsmY